MGDPLFQLGIVSRGARLGHALHEVEAHLLFEVEGALDAGGLHLPCADALAEVRERLILADSERGTGEDARFVPSEENLLKLFGDVDGGAVEGEVAVLATGLLRPIDVTFLLLLEECGDGGAQIGEALGHVVKLETRVLVLGLIARLDGLFCHTLKGERYGVLDDAGLADAELAPMALKATLRLSSAEEILDGGDGLLDLSHAIAIAVMGEEAFASTRIEKAAELEAHVRFADMKPELPRCDVLDGVRLIDDDEVAREKEIHLIGGQFLGGREQCKKEGVI